MFHLHGGYRELVAGNDVINKRVILLAGNRAQSAVARWCSDVPRVGGPRAPALRPRPGARLGVAR